MQGTWGTGPYCRVFNCTIGALWIATPTLLEAPHRVHLDDVIIWGPNSTSKSATLGFNAHPGAQVPVDLKIVAPRLQESGLEAEEIILYGDRLHGS